MPADRHRSPEEIEAANSLVLVGQQVFPVRVTTPCRTITVLKMPDTWDERGIKKVGALFQAQCARQEIRNRAGETQKIDVVTPGALIPEDYCLKRQKIAELVNHSRLIGRRIPGNTRDKMYKCPMENCDQPFDRNVW